MFKIPLGFPDTSTFPEHGIRFGGIDAYYITMNAISIEKDENIWKDLGLTSVRKQIEEKVTDFMAENELSDLTWTGRWFFTEETKYERKIYAQFQRRPKPRAESSH